MTLRGQLVGDALQAAAQRAVDHQIAAAQYGPADQLRVDLAVQAYLALQALAEREGDLLPLRLVERCGGGHGDVRDTLGRIFQRIELRGDLRQVGQAVIVGQRAQEIL